MRSPAPAVCRPRDVGYAGRKDRHAITRQWFSLEGVEPERALDFQIEGAQRFSKRNATDTN